MNFLRIAVFTFYPYLPFPNLSSSFHRAPFAQRSLSSRERNGSTFHLIASSCHSSSSTPFTLLLLLTLSDIANVPEVEKAYQSECQSRSHPKMARSTRSRRFRPHLNQRVTLVLPLVSIIELAWCLRSPTRSRWFFSNSSLFVFFSAFFFFHFPSTLLHRFTSNILSSFMLFTILPLFNHLSFLPLLVRSS